MPIATPFKFNFKSRSIRDEAGNEIGRTKKQPSLTVDLPIPSATELQQLLAKSGKEAELILGTVADCVYQAARNQFDDVIETLGDSDQELTVGNLDFSRLDFSYLANMPPAARGATAITDAEWQQFFDDYMAVMTVATGKETKRINNHIIHYKKPQRAKSNKALMQLLIDQLDIYMVSTNNLDDTGPCAIRLRNRFDRWLKEPEEEVDMSLL